VAVLYYKAIAFALLVFDEDVGDMDRHVPSVLSHQHPLMLVVYFDLVGLATEQ